MSCRLRGGEESKAEGVSKSGWETMERDHQWGSISGTSIACQTVFPGKTPMCPLCSARDCYSGWGD